MSKTTQMNNSIQALSFLAYFIIAVILSSCSEDKRINEELDNIEDILSEKPDSAITLCNKLETRNLEFRHRQRMRLELLRGEAQNKAYVDFPTDSILKKVVEYYNQNGTDLEKMRANYVLGCAYRDMGETPQAIDCYYTATLLGDGSSSDKEKRCLSTIFSQMASLYHQQLMLSEEIECREKAIRLSEQLGETQDMAYDYCMIAGAYSLLNQDKAAEQALLRAKELYQSTDSDKWILFSPMLMNLYLKQDGKLDATKKLIDEYKSSYAKASNGKLIPEAQRQFYYYEGKYYEKTGNLDSAEICYRQIYRPHMTYTQKDPMYRGLLRLYQLRNRGDSIAKYAQLLSETNDSSIALVDRELVSRMAAAYRYSRYQKEANAQSRKAAETRFHLVLVLTVSIILLLVSSFVILGMRRRRIEKQAEIDRLAHEYEETEKDYQEKIRYVSVLEQTQKKMNEVIKKELDASRKEADHRQALYEESQKEISEINRQYGEMVNANKEEIGRLKSKIDDLSRHGGISVNVTRKSNFLSLPIIQEVLQLADSPLGELSSSEWEQLTKVYCEYYPELIHDLQNSPRITKQGVHACLLFALNMRSGDIANILKSNIQRVSNLKLEINEALFDDRTAKNLFKNLKQKYDIYTGI